MQAQSKTDERKAQVTQISQSDIDLHELRQHLQEMVSGPAFKSSHRSAQFLTYIMEQAIARNFDSLKERVIGVELFGRSPSYNTGEDSIVRTTASDVRKRLLQHYGSNGTSSKFRLSLPLGSYILEIAHSSLDKSDLIEEPASASPANSLITTVVEEHLTTVSRSDILESDRDAASVQGATVVKTQDSFRWVFLSLLFVAVIAVCVAGTTWYRFSRPISAAARAPLWSALFDSAHPTHLVTSDYALVGLREITGKSVSLADYANRKYLPESNQATPEELRYFTALLAGSSTSDVDAPIIARVSALAQQNQKAIDTRASRHITISDLRTDDNFIFLGSPSSNPWSSLFSNELDFQFVIDKATQREIIQNVRPGPHEPPAYVPTALGGGTGESYAIVALVQNLDQNGQVLIVGGANGEGTDAAGRLITDPLHLWSALKSCGMEQRSPLRHFELVLRLSTLAGSPTHLDVVACHLLPGTASR
ncbi:hypothetical protein SAMN05421770_101878 [Granulicella rosea]|uniref:Adenylate cyclase n=1 Tax=Granulicella rosea TaxID=474952 RepID=A0A239EAV0_9BACT|nr:hypothetical protein [Granulicella rosea]SNS41619.1 hypothetical protein SAMN05421770_101878 [Granulicella rosea]